MIIIRRLLVLLLIIICCGMIANADGNKSFKCENNTYSSTGRQYASSTSQTPYFWTDSKGNKYPIYISSSGSCYVIKKSNKTGKEYKNYLGPDISQDICKSLIENIKVRRNEIYIYRYIASIRSSISFLYVFQK